MNNTIDEITGLKWASELYNGNPTLERAGLIAVDIDNFNRFHSKFGQEKCEDAVAHVSKVLQQTLPDNAEVFRIPPSFGIRGGVRFAACMLADEFIALIPDVTNDELALNAHRLNDALAKNPLSLNYPNLVIEEEVSLSIGYSLAEGESATQVAQKAWDASMIAKTTGKRRAVEWDPSAKAKESFLVSLDLVTKPVSYTHLTLPTTPYV